MKWNDENANENNMESLMIKIKWNTNKWYIKQVW